MNTTEDTLKIGLFGTCGGSTWRDAFIKKYETNKIGFFNPVVEDWDPSCAEVEAWNLAHDEILIFPITKETYAAGSLSESGFSIMQGMKFSDRRDVIIMIEQELIPGLMPSDTEKILMKDMEARGIEKLEPADKMIYRMVKKKADRAKDSLRSRALVNQHLKMLQLDTVFVVDTLQEALDVSMACYRARVSMNKWKKEFNPQNRG